MIRFGYQDESLDGILLFLMLQSPSKYTDVTFNAKLKLKLIKISPEKLKIYMSLFSSLSLFVRNEVSVENALRMSFPG